MMKKIKFCIHERLQAHFYHYHYNQSKNNHTISVLFSHSLISWKSHTYFNKIGFFLKFHRTITKIKNISKKKKLKLQSFSQKLNFK